jgi:hypothetical protein
MAPEMLAVLLWNLAGFTGLYGWMFQLAVRAKRLECVIEKEEIS